MPRKKESEEHPMNEIVKVKLSEIDPESTVNVRRIGIEESVKEVKFSIEKNGYWPEFPIVLRPHPDLQSEFAYENVSGQCRAEACRQLEIEGKLGLKEIPAVIADLDDNAALKRSFDENDKSTPLSFRDYTHWVEKKYNEFRAQGCTAGEAYQKTAEFWNISVDGARNYYNMGILPESVKKKVEDKILFKKTAKAIADSSRGFDDPQEAQKIMEEKAEAFLNRDEDQRKDFEEVMKKSGHKATVEEIEEKVEKQTNGAKREIKVTIPSDNIPRMMQWGAERGLSDLKSIVGNMIVEALKGKN